MFRQPIGNGLQINRVIAKALHQLGTRIGGHACHDFLRPNIHSGSVRIDFAQSIEGMRLLNAFRALSSLSLIILLGMGWFWQAPVNQDFSFLIGVIASPPPPLDTSI